MKLVYEQDFGDLTLEVTRTRGIRSQRFWWTVSRRGEALAKSSEGYHDRSHAIDMGTRFAHGYVLWLEQIGEIG